VLKPTTLFIMSRKKKSNFITINIHAIHLTQQL
jgi:hypothetical protein